MDKYRLDLKSEDDFEKIVVRICRDLLGKGATGFAKGKDGGRDGSFEGKAQNYPSDTPDSWKGKFIIQAKHTTNTEASCSDNEFFGNKTSIVAKEIVKIKKLKGNNEIDNYICFTNRKLTGNKKVEIESKIKSETKVENVSIHGIEFIELNLTKEIIKEFDLNRSLLPFEFYEQDIRDVILLFSKELEETEDKKPITIEDFHNDRPEDGIKAKNRINNLSDEYFEDEIRRNSQEYFKQIDRFLKDIINIKYLRQYKNTVRELNNLILIKRDDFEKFEEIFFFIYQQIFRGNEDEIKEHRFLIYVFLHFMYFQCEIGRNE